MGNIDKIAVPEWYRTAKESGMTPAELHKRLHAHCREALMRRADGAEPSETLVELTTEMYEHALSLRNPDA